ncbi:hypothetical protein Dimus_024294 [Dionaea muscipula]
MHFSSPKSPSPPQQFLLLFLFFSTIFPSFSHPFFPPQNIALNGDAYFINNVISLTQEHNPCPSNSSWSSSPSPSPSPDSPSSSKPSVSGFGRALSAYPIRFLNPTTNATASFSCRFSFTIIPSPLCSAGDGIAFIIVSSGGSSFIQTKNQHMGLPDLGSDSQDTFLAVEFDTHWDVSVGDINGNHVGIDVSSFNSLASVDAYSKGIDLSNGRHLTAWVEYRDNEKMMRVWVSYYPLKPFRPALIAQIDLSKDLKEFMHVGFSASNGPGGSAVHIVDRWRFRTFGLMGSMKQMEVLDGDDIDDDERYCFMCSPEEMDVGLHRFDSMPKRVSIRHLVLVLGGVAAATICLIAFVVLISCCYKRRRRRVGGGEKRGQVNRLQLNKVPARLSITEVKSATGGFNKSRIVGEGASAIVYQGFLPGGRLVAVKRFKTVSSIEGYVNPFTNEFAAMARCLRHRNLVQLLGWCCEHKELVLVYEYMPNGSLEKILHRSSDSVNILTWEQRLNIVLGVASALTYLHEGCDRQIIHRDVKTCNIMLDADFTAKLGDFGLAEVYEHTSLPRDATIPAGTMGYLAPEYVYTGVPTVKTDVYSFGVVILEVASGRRPVDCDGIVLGNWVWGLWERGTLFEAVDSRLRGRYSRVEMDRMLKVALWCVHPDSEKRPTVREAARMLRCERQLPLLPVRKPRVALHSVFPQDAEDTSTSVDDENHAFDSTPWLTPRTHFY